MRSLLLFFQEMLFFLAVQVWGVWTAQKMVGLYGKEQFTAPFSLGSFLYLILAVGLGTLILLSLLRLPRGRVVFFKFFFILAAWWGSTIAFSSFFADRWALITASALIVAWLWLPRIFLHNLIVASAAAGAGAVLGINFSPGAVALLLILFAVYDFIAVYKTKHMVKLARAMVRFRSVFALIIPERLSWYFSRLREARPGQGFLLLGGGDLVFPLFMAAAFVPQAGNFAYLIIPFSVLGAAASFLIFFLLGRRPFPALPPIALFTLLGYAVLTLAM